MQISCLQSVAYRLDKRELAFAAAGEQVVKGPTGRQTEYRRRIRRLDGGCVCGRRAEEPDTGRHPGGNPGGNPGNAQEFPCGREPAVTPKKDVHDLSFSTATSGLIWREPRQTVIMALSHTRCFPDILLLPNQST